MAEQREGYMADQVQSPTAQVLSYLASKGMKPSSENVRTVLEANARDSSILPNLRNQAPPQPDTYSDAQMLPAKSGAGGGGRGITFTPPDYVPRPNSAGNTSAPPTTDTSSSDLATAALLGIPLAALGAGAWKYMRGRGGDITEPAPPDAPQLRLPPPDSGGGGGGGRPVQPKLPPSGPGSPALEAPPPVLGLPAPNPAGTNVDIGVGGQTDPLQMALQRATQPAGSEIHDITAPQPTTPAPAPDVVPPPVTEPALPFKAQIRGNTVRPVPTGPSPHFKPGRFNLRVP